jgi:hypothetical protein
MISGSAAWFSQQSKGEDDKDKTKWDVTNENGDLTSKQVESTTKRILVFNVRLQICMNI